MVLMEMKIYSNCANVLKKYFLPPIHDDLSYICRKVVVKFTPNYCPYNILPSMQHCCDTVQLSGSMVTLKLLLHQTRYNKQYVWMRIWMLSYAMWTVIHIRANERILHHIYLLIHTEITYLPAAADALVDGALGPSSLCPTRWHQPTGYMSGLSQSSHWSYSSSQPSKCIFRRRPTTRDTVPTHTNRGSMRSAASNLMPTTKPWAGISCRQMIKRQAAPRYEQGCWTNKQN